MPEMSYFLLKCSKSSGVARPMTPKALMTTGNLPFHKLLDPGANSVV